VSTIDFTDGSYSNIVSWSWTFGDGNSSTATNPSHTYPNDQTYTFLVTLYVEDANGCKDTITEVVTVYPDFYFYTPNAFTPNNDIRNVTYGGVGSGIESYRMIIFNRWGQKLFESNDINIQWDGKVNGTRVQEDVYIAIFDVKGPLDQEVHKVTHVTVIR
jgi:gliding motility-associated-like protein